MDIAPHSAFTRGESGASPGFSTTIVVSAVV